MHAHGTQHRRVTAVADGDAEFAPQAQGADAEGDEEECQQRGVSRNDMGVQCRLPAERVASTESGCDVGP